MRVNKKKLPKAIRPPAGDIHETSWVASVSGPREALAGITNGRETTTAPVAVHDSGGFDNVFNMAPADREVDTTRRKSQARAIVERHALYSAVGGIVPLPIVNIASITAVIVRMVKVLSDLYDMPFERDRARAIVVGLMGGAMPTGLAAATASTLVYIVPGSNLISLAVSSITAIACTRGIGRIFVEHFENGATLIDFPGIERS